MFVCLLSAVLCFPSPEHKRSGLLVSGAGGMLLETSQQHLYSSSPDLRPSFKTRSTSSCSSSESSSLTTGLALLRPVRRLRAFPRSLPFSFLPRRIFTFTERAGAESKEACSITTGHNLGCCDWIRSRAAYIQTRILPPALPLLPRCPPPRSPPLSRSSAADW